VSADHDEFRVAFTGLADRFAAGALKAAHGQRHPTSRAKAIFRL
jgi:hypothetical protein